MKAEGVVPVLQVADLPMALEFYKSVLGFTEDFHSGQYAGIRLDDACFHLCAHTFHQRPVGGGTASIFCDEVDLYCDEIRTRGAKVKSEPGNRDYGLRDFVVVDPDGNHLTFGCESKPA